MFVCLPFSPTLTHTPSLSLTHMNARAGDISGRLACVWGAAAWHTHIHTHTHTRSVSHPHSHTFSLSHKHKCAHMQATFLEDPITPGVLLYGIHTHSLLHTHTHTCMRHFWKTPMCVGCCCVAHTLSLYLFLTHTHVQATSLKTRIHVGCSCVAHTHTLSLSHTHTRAGDIFGRLESMWGVAVWPCRPACCHAYESGVCC